jgi:ABC-type multidrug transport system ATPase subunit
MVYDIEITDLEKNYSGEHALAGVSLSIGKGCLFGLIGADGAGKSTLLRICTTLVAADKGTARVCGLDTVKEFQKIRSQIGYMPQKFSLYQDLSVRENMQFFADLFGVEAKEREARMKRLLEFSRLAPFQDRRARNLSGGMKQKLALSCTLIHTPAVLFLDEPTTGVDPVSRREFWAILKELKNQGITIVISTPYMDEAHLCDELLFLHKGKMMRQGKPEALLAAYPYPLYKLWSDSSLLTIAHNASLPPGIALMYPEGGAIHAAVKDTTIKENDVLSLVKQLLPNAEHVEKASPKIEDLFIYLLSEKKESWKLEAGS